MSAVFNAGDSRDSRDRITRLVDAWTVEWRVSKFLGVEWRVQPTALLVLGLYSLVLAVFTYPQTLPAQGPLTYLVMALLTLPLISAGVVLHELAHVLAAQPPPSPSAPGAPGRSVVFTGLGGRAYMPGRALSARRQVLVSGAGPLANLGIGVTCLFLQGSLLLSPSHSPLPELAMILGHASALNLVFAAYNLMPVLPADGGWMLHGLLSYFDRDKNAGNVRNATLKWGVYLSLLLMPAAYILSHVWPEERSVFIVLFLLSLMSWSRALRLRREAREGRENVWSERPVSTRRAEE